MSFNNQVFYHNGIIYEFKYAKLDSVLNLLPEELGTKINLYFNHIQSPDFPSELFNDPKIIRCSVFRVKYLKRGARNLISEKFINSKIINVYKIEDSIILKDIISDNKEKNQENITDDINNLSLSADNPKILKELVVFATELFYDYYSKGLLKPNHDQILTKCLLSCNTALSVETPIWTKKQSALTDFTSRKSDFNLDYNYKYSITGHIDLLLYDSENDVLVVSDYKPEGQFLYSMPQVAMYALILKKILGLKSIKCISFNRMEGWYYDPVVAMEHLEKDIIKHGTPKINNLKWRKIIRNLIS